MPTPHKSAEQIRRQLDRTIDVACMAISAYLQQNFKHAARLHYESESLYAEALEAITHVTDAEAHLIEPTLAELEKDVLKLRRLAGAQSNGALANGVETILVVEDDEAFRYTQVRMLTSKGYKVLEAADGAEALEISRHHRGPIHLLCTDVTMPPGICGPELARQLTAERAETKVLYVTAAEYGPFPALRRPFTEAELIAKIEEILHSPPLVKAAEAGA